MSKVKSAAAVGGRIEEHYDDEITQLIKMGQNNRGTDDREAWDSRYRGD